LRVLRETSVARIQQAGAVVVRLDGPEPRFLLVKARRDPTVWIFPKGHVEEGETAEQTALRETEEEAGVIGRVLAPIGALEFESGGRPLHVEYFLVELLGDASWSERRPFVWGTYDETRARIEFENARQLLSRAKAALPDPGP
jgi:8-oxo-dGTP pyrophosphatase MutT (NUDIX family)